jgi:hypothetical protein
MELALAMVNLLNAAAPGIASLIMVIRRKDGSIAIGTMLDEADAQFAENLGQAAAWFKAHQPSPTVTK